jgi:hypothetical protein
VFVPFLCVSLVAQQAPQTTTPAPAPSAPQAAAPQPPPAPTPPPPPDTLVDGTPIKLSLAQSVSSGSAQTGQEVPFTVEQDILVSGVTVIKKGSTAIGIVTDAEKHKTMGRAGKLAIGISSVLLADNEKATLRGDQESKGKAHTQAATTAAVATGAAAVLVLGAVFLPAAPALLLIHGKNTTVNQGTEIVAYVDGDMHLDMTKFGGTPSAAPATAPGATGTYAPIPPPGDSTATAYAPVPPPADTTDPNQALLAIKDAGVYLKDTSGAWTPIDAETVTFKVNSLKNFASAGIMKGDLNGSLTGAQSKLRAALPVTFAVCMPDGASIADYQLLRFHSANGARQFRSVNGAVLHKASEPTHDAIQTQPEKISAHLYTITIERVLGSGEYGVLPPGAPTPSGSNKESTGKIYTVSVTE